MDTRFTQEMLERAIELQRKCWSHERIAAELGVHRVTISKQLSRHNRRMMAAMEKRAIATKARQLAQLEWMICEAVQGWERSKLAAEAEKVVEEAIKMPDGSTSPAVIVKTERTSKGQAGNPAYLETAAARMADIRKILGMDVTRVEAEVGVKQVEVALSHPDPDTIAQAVALLNRIEHGQGGAGGPDHVPAEVVPPQAVPPTVGLPEP